MTIKEAFEKLHKAVKKSGMNPFFLIGNLKDEFKDIADNIVDSGSIVDVVPAQDSGYLVGNVKVNGEDNYLFAPPQVIPPHIYSDTERLAGVWFHGGVSEDVYERTWDFSGSPVMLTYADWVNSGISASENIKSIISAELRYGTVCLASVEVGVNVEGYPIGFQQLDSTNTRGVSYCTLRYTKNN